MTRVLCLACGKLCFHRLTIPARTKTLTIARVCNVTCRNKLTAEKSVVIQKLATVATPESIRPQHVRWTGKNRR